MLRKLIIILFLNVYYFTGLAQSSVDVCDCSANFGGVQGDNYLEINFSDVEIKEVAGSNYLYFSINLKSSANWYDGRGALCGKSKKFVTSLDIRFNFNRDMFGATEETVPIIELVEYGKGMNVDDEEYTWGQAYALSSEWSVVTNQGDDILMAILAFSESGNGNAFRLNNTTSTFIGRFRWKLKAGNGRTGVSLRIPTSGDDYIGGIYPTMAYTYDGGTRLGICVTGESLDIPVGGGTPAPTISKIEGPTPLCSGTKNASYKATADDATAKFAWKVKQGGTDVTSSVVDGTLGDGSTVSINWKPAANGAYSVCAVATNSTGAGSEKCFDVTINGAPTLNLSEKDAKTSVCAGETVNLVATSGLRNYKWYQNNGTAISGATTDKYSPKVPTTGNLVTYKVQAESAQGCPASAELPITINPLPKVDIITEVANKNGRLPGKYGVGDHIHMEAKDADVSLYDYKWSDGKGHEVAGTKYDIASAIEDKYDITLTVTNKTTRCTSSKTVSLTKDPACGIVTIALSGTDNNRICTGGICRLTARVMAQCDANTIIGYAWYNAAGIKLDSVGVSNATSHTYIAKVADTYTVRVYTVSGMRTETLNVTSRSTQAAIVNAPENLFVRSNHSILLTAECAAATTWVWEPALLLESNTQQYVQTKKMTAPHRFYVYVTDQLDCMSMDSTMVNISDNALIVDILPEKRPLVVCNKGSMTLEANVSGGAEPYTYSWTDDIHTVSGTATKKVTVFKHNEFGAPMAQVVRRVVTVTDNSGMTGQAMVDINVTGTLEPALTISGGGTICEGAKVEVTKNNSTPVSNYTWYIRDNKDGAITSKTQASDATTLTFDKRGDYYVWVTATAGDCVSDTTGKGIAVKVNGFDLAWSTQPANYKLGANIVAEAQASNGATPYTFTWNALRAGSPVSVATANPNKYQVTGATESAYTFKVTAQDNNACTKILEAPVSGSLSGGLDLRLLAKSVTQCNGGAVLMKATASGGSNSYNFKWYKAGNESNPLQTASLAGSPVSNQLVAGGFASGDKIVVKVTDNSSPVLTRTDTVTISTLGTQAPVVYAGDDFKIGKGANTILFGETTSGVATEWNWADASDLASAAEASKQYPLTKNLTTQKEYTVYVKDAAGCYSMPDKVIVSIDNNPFSIAINDPLTICKGNTVNLKATPTPAGTVPVSWEWKEASGQFTGLTLESPVFAATTAGATTVYLKAKNAQGVVATASRIITVKDAQAPVLKLDGLNSMDAVCSKTPLTVSSTNGITLVTSTWYLGANMVQSGTSMTYYPNVTELSALNLKVEVTSQGAGCPAVNNIEKGITIYTKPQLAWGKSSTPALVMLGGEVKAVAKIKDSDGLGNVDYTYVWTHVGSKPGVTYTDGGTTVSRVDSAISTANLGAGGATTETQPYYFKAYAIDGNGCHSDTLNHSVGINGDALYVELKSVYGNYCVGGSALLKADVQGVAEENLNYEWFKNGALISLETGRELLVANPNATDTYKVKATLKDATKSGESVVLQLVAGVNTAATLTGDELKIPKGTKTALAVTSAGAAIESWQWSPVDKLAAGESTLPSPYTIELANNQDYKVYAVDENNCVTAPALVKVTVLTVAKPGTGGEGDPDPGIFAYVYPAPSTICVGNMLNLHAVVWGDPTGATTYEWSSQDNLTLTEAGAKAVFTAVAVGKYSYTVKVKRGSSLVTMARVDITVVPGVLPDLAVNVDSTYKACAGSDLVLQINNKNDVRIKKYTWIINGRVDPNVTGNRYTWPSVSVATNVSVKVIAETEGHCASNAVTLDSIVKPALKLNPLQVVDSCGQVKLFSDAGPDATYSWNLKNADLQLTDKKDTVYIKSKTAFTAASIPYDIAVSVSPKGGGCQSKGEITGKIYFQPLVKLEAWTPAGESIGLPYMVTEKGSEPVVYVDKDKSKYTLGTNATENWSASAPTFVPGTGAARINNIQKDDTVRLVVANKEASKCISKDSMPIYLYPEAPKVDIDTNTCLTDIAIKWPSLSADSVRVWGIVEDAYNVNGGGYKRLASVKTSALKWIEPNMNDRLKFYYLQSVKRIGGRSFVSKVASDTVGWLKQTVYGVNPSGITSSNNLIAYPFDMSAKGIRTNRDLYHKLLGKNAGYKEGFTGEWNFATQTWNLDQYVEFFGSMSWEGTEKNLKAGLAYWAGISPSTPSVDVLMYGKLLRFTYDFEINTTPGMASTSYILYPLSMINNRTRQYLGDAIPSDALGHYDIRKQVYDNAYYVEFFGSWSWDPLEADDTVLLNGWQPVRVLAKRKVLNWTK